MNVDLSLEQKTDYSISDSTTGYLFKMISAETHQIRKLCREELEHKTLKKHFMLKIKSATLHSHHLIPQYFSGKRWKNSTVSEDGE